MPSIIEAVEFRREQYGLTKRDWAKVIGMQPGHYTEFTQGKKGLSLQRAAMCFQFGVPAEHLFQCTSNSGIDEAHAVIKAFKENQNGTRKTFPLSGRYKDVRDTCDFGEPLPLYAAPVRTKDLTDDEIAEIPFNRVSDDPLLDFARAVIAADRRKNK